MTEHKKSPYYSLGRGSSSKGSRLISPYNIRFIQRDLRLSQFGYIFRKIAKNAKAVCKNAEGKNVVNILKLLDKIIPLQYFGTTKHRKLFYNIVKLILTRSAHECIFARQITRGFDLKLIPWLAQILKERRVNSKMLCRRYFFEAQLWLLEKIVKPLITRVYTPVRKGQTHEIELVSKRIWRSFLDKVVNYLKRRGYLVNAVNPTVSRGLLQIKPKDGYQEPSEFRPIIRLTAGRSTNQRKIERYKKINRTICAAAQKLCSTNTSNLYHHWKNYVVATEGQSIFGVKVDIKDAFGNVNIDFLCYILETQYVKGEIPLTIKNIITSHVQNQFVTYGKTKSGTPNMWQWKLGLLQGDRFSSALCELYMSYLDALYLDKMNKLTTFIHRTVDDYFFCSTKEEEVEEFIKIMCSIHTLNMKKTESSVTSFGNNQISYCGQVFLMDTKQVKGLYNFKKGTEIRHRFRLWNLKRPIFYKQQEQKSIEQFLKRPMMLRSNSFHFQGIELNTVFNTEDTVVDNYFQAMIYLAIKFSVTLLAVHHGIKNFSLVTKIIKLTIHKYARKAVMVLDKNKGQNYSGSLSLEVFLKIGFQAFVVVLKKHIKSRVPNLVEPLIKYMRKIYVINRLVRWKNMKTLPKIFNNISTARRLPHIKINK